jgi:signal transduction histidine kinase
MTCAATDAEGVAVESTQERSPAGLPAAAAAGVLEQAPFGACILRDGRVVHANRWLRELGGAPGILPDLLALVHPEDRPLAARELTPGPADDVPAVPTVRLRDPSGGWRFVEWCAAGIVLDEGPAVRVLLLDVTERVRAEARLRERAAELEQANQLRRIFGDVLTHDLTNPVWVAENYLALALDGEVPESKRALCEALRGSLAKARRILADARTYLKVLELGGAAPETLDLGAVATATAESLRLLAEAKGQRVSVTVDGSAAAQADPLLQEALWQLVANAVKYGPPDSVIEVVVRGGPAVRVEVRDRGPGVPAADRERIFHRYERVDKGPIAGVGLGLSIAARILRLHGGDLRVEDNPGGGSRFIAEISAP